MRNVEIHDEIHIEDPTMLAGWPGMGEVALRAVDYIKKKLKAKLFAEIDMADFSAPEAIVVEEGVGKLPGLPRSAFYWVKEPPLLFFEGEKQPLGKAGIALIKEILDLAQTYKVRRIYTGAAFPLPVSHTAPCEVYGVASDKALQAVLLNYGVKPMMGGQISGLNGLLMGYAAKRKIEAICLLATLPAYAINFPNPKASKAVVGVLQEMLHIQVDMRDLDLSIQSIEKKMDAIERSVKGILPIAKEKEQPPKGEEDKVPKYVMEKIEHLFREAKTDKNKAYLLKRELDRWNLYKLYEDRFLDLFKGGQ